ncbi:MAG: hypothetical protein RIG84_08735 [Roseovarius sp.]
MTDAAYSPAHPRRHASWLSAEPRLAATGIVLALSLAATLPALMLDTRLFQGENVWIKPVKFQVALAVYLFTLTFFARFLPEGMTARRTYRAFSWLVVFAIVAEMVWIGGAAMLQTASHFNTSSPLMEALYGLMGVFAVTLTAMSLVYAIAIWRNPASGLAPATRLSIALGLGLTFVLTVIAAGTLSMQGGHFIGTPQTGAALPLMGWSGEVGDLRVAHFFATHALHFLPLAGLAATWALPQRAALRATWAASLAFTAFVAFTYAQALMGLPLIPLG